MVQGTWKDIIDTTTVKVGPGEYILGIEEREDLIEGAFYSSWRFRVSVRFLGGCLSDFSFPLSPEIVKWSIEALRNASDRMQTYTDRVGPEGVEPTLRGG